MIVAETLAYVVLALLLLVNGGGLYISLKESNGSGKVFFIAQIGLLVFVLILMIIVSLVGG